MGVAGAAWGTNIGVPVEMLHPARGRADAGDARAVSRRRLAPAPRRAATLLAVGLPSGLQIVADVLAWALFTVWVMGRVRHGRRWRRTTSCSATCRQLHAGVRRSRRPSRRWSGGTSARAGPTSPCAARTSRLRRRGGATCWLCGLLFLFGRNALMGLFTHDPEVLRHRRDAADLRGRLSVLRRDVHRLQRRPARRGRHVRPRRRDRRCSAGASPWAAGTSSRGGAPLGPGGPWTMATVYGVILGVFMFLRFRAAGGSASTWTGSRGLQSMPQSARTCRRFRYSAEPVNSRHMSIMTTERRRRQKKKNYKETLNLPQTAFPMEAKLVQNEPARLKKWQEGAALRQGPSTPARFAQGQVGPARRPAVRQRRHPHRPPDQQDAQGRHHPLPHDAGVPDAVRPGLGLPRPADRAQDPAGAGAEAARDEHGRRPQQVLRVRREVREGPEPSSSSGWASSASGTIRT